MEITVEQVKELTPDITKVINNLLRQLSPDSRILNDEDVKKIIKDISNYFFVARETVGNKIVGMLTLIIFNTPSAKKALIEGVVVDQNYQGKGIGAMLVERAIDKAREEGVMRIELTSNPKRIQANSLYQRLGFKKRDTNVYEMEL